jgi:hypothetical protein
MADSINMSAWRARRREAEKREQNVNRELLNRQHAG